MTDLNLNTLNPGIRATVEWLRRHGFNTTDSGDGETCEYECDAGRPYVHMTVPPGHLVSEIDRLVELLAGAWDYGAVHGRRLLSAVSTGQL